MILSLKASLLKRCIHGHLMNVEILSIRDLTLREVIVLSNTILNLIVSHSLKYPDIYQIHVDYFYSSDHDFLYSDLIVWDLDHSCPCLSLRLLHPLLVFLNSHFSLSQIAVLDHSHGYIDRFSISRKFTL